MRHEDAEPEQDKIIPAITETLSNFIAVAAGRKTIGIGPASHHACASRIDRRELTFCPVGKKQGQIGFAVLRAIIEVIQPRNGRSKEANCLAIMGLLMKIRNIIAHPYDFASQLMLEPHCTPLRRPMMRVPDIMLDTHGSSEMCHIEVAANERRPAKPLKMAAADISNVQVLAYLGKTIGTIVCARIEAYYVPLLRQSSGQGHALPLSAALN